MGEGMIPTESRMWEIHTSDLTSGGEETRFMSETEALARGRKLPANCYPEHRSHPARRGQDAPSQRAQAGAGSGAERPWPVL